MRAGETPSTGLQRAPDWDSVHSSSKIFRKNKICMRAVAQYGATTVAAESLIAQLHSQGKITTASRESFEIITLYVRLGPN
jgi:hypothetical protein